MHGAHPMDSLRPTCPRWRRRHGAHDGQWRTAQHARAARRPAV